jgi:hypothetical protein
MAKTSALGKFLPKPNPISDILCVCRNVSSICPISKKNHGMMIFLKEPRRELRKVKIKEQNHWKSGSLIESLSKSTKTAREFENGIS